jgi:hypothetical protein
LWPALAGIDGRRSGLTHGTRRFSRHTTGIFICRALGAPTARARDPRRYYKLMQ